VSFLCSTLRRWRNGQCIETWEAHKGPIQAVIKLPTGELVTGIITFLQTTFHYHLLSYSLRVVFLRKYVYSVYATFIRVNVFETVFWIEVSLLTYFLTF
jgi:hypothetical protein